MSKQTQSSQLWLPIKEDFFVLGQPDFNWTALLVG